MKLFLTLATLTALASAIVLPTIDEPFPMPTVIKNPQPFPMPTFIDEPAPPKPTFVEEPMACTKICAFSKEVLNCGKNWWPRKSGVS